MVNHLDDRAAREVRAIHSRLLRSGSKVLDLMSSWNSHLAASHDSYRVTGLGLNQEELTANPCLAETVVQDLNRKPELPFADNSFDAIICTASIEYLIWPLEVLAEIARVTTPGGMFITTFSDRWFSGKEIDAWADLHPFERLGLVVDYYHKTKKIEKIHTESIVGLPRPLNDKHRAKTHVSDPIFVVWGRVKWPQYPLRSV